MHGGDRYRNKVRLDLSVNLNPLGTPPCLIEGINRGLDKAIFYPDPLQERARNAAAELYGRKTEILPEWVIPGNGASELINAVIHGIMPRSILIPVPCFTGYLRAEKEGCRIDRHTAAEAQGFVPDESFGLAVRADTELIILTSPGNPGGRMIDPLLLRRYLQLAGERNIPVLLDECFISFTGREKESGLYLLKEYPNLMVLRAFTKIFSLPGLRLGILFTADERLGNKIRKALPEWNLSSFAEEALFAAADNREEIFVFLDKTAEETRRLRKLFMQSLTDIGIEVYPSDSGFFLTKGLAVCRRQLLDQGVLIRSCGDMCPLNDEYIRLAVRPEKEQVIFTDILLRSRKLIRD